MHDLCLISWKVTKCLSRYYYSKSLISSYRKAVIITGCDSGFGNRLAHKLNQIGFVVYATVLNTDSDGSKYLQNNCVFPNNMHIIQMDVTKEDDVNNAYNYVCEHLKKQGIELWGLVNNAGILFFSHIEWSSLDLYHKMFDINVFGVIRVTRTFLPLIRQSKGRIVNLASIYAKITQSFLSHYCMSKHSIQSFTDALRRELHQWDINVCAILPGPFNTNLFLTDIATQGFDNAWNTSNENVKQSHGLEYYNNKRNEMIGGINLFKKNRNIDLVVDAIIDALTNKYPQISFMVNDDWLTSILIFFNDILPTECMDQLMLFGSYLVGKNK